MPRRNRVDPLGDLHAVSSRGLFLGNRGCLVDDERRLVRHHRGNLWITCVLAYKDWRSPLDQPRHWTPLFFLDDAVALAAGHRPCGLCRRTAYLSYQAAVTTAMGATRPVMAPELNRRLQAERLHRGGGLERAGDRKIWREHLNVLPFGSVIAGDDGVPMLVLDETVMAFSFEGWTDPSPRVGSGEVDVITPPTSVHALANGYRPILHPSAGAVGG